MQYRYINKINYGMKIKAHIYNKNCIIDNSILLKVAKNVLKAHSILVLGILYWHCYSSVNFFWLRDTTLISYEKI